MNLFLDTNIIIDLVGDRKPFSKWAYQIFADQKNAKWTLYTSSYSILSTYYIIEKEIGAAKAKKTIKFLLSRLQIQAIDKMNLLSSIVAKFNDYEDAVQHECAKSCESIDYIVTRNKKDFKNSIIKVLSSEELYINS